MSDHFIFLVPRDPMFVPTDEVRRRVVGVLNRIAPNAESISAEACAQVEFFDCGQNFERISCPHCSAEIGIDWWQDRMSEDIAVAGFRLDRYKAPCCAKSVNLNELNYDWPQAFGRFNWIVRNPNIGEITAAAKIELEAVAGFALVPIHQHV